MKTVYRYLITAGVGLLIVLLVVLMKNGFEEQDVEIAMQIWCDAFFVSGVFLTCGGLIVVASNGGVFDMLGYAVSLLWYTFKSSKVERKYKTFYDYREARKDRKRSVSFVLVVAWDWRSSPFPSCSSSCTRRWARHKQQNKRPSPKYGGGLFCVKRTWRGRWGGECRE